MIDILTITTSDLPILKTFNLIKVILNIAFIVVPIILIVVSTIDLLKMLFNPNEKKNISKLLNRFISSVVIFFIPILVNFVMGLVGQSSVDKIELWNNANEITIKKLTILKEKENVAKKRQQEEKEIENAKESVTKTIDTINALIDKLGDNLSSNEKEEINKLIEEAKITSDYKLGDEKRKECLKLIDSLRKSDLDIKDDLNKLSEILNNGSENVNKSNIENCLDNIYLKILLEDKIDHDIEINFNKLKNNLNFNTTNLNNIKNKLKELNKKSSSLNSKLVSIENKNKKESEKNNSNFGTTVSAAGLSKREELVAYATSFVGKLKYVYGGTSLTTGADCSGFTMLIYQHFGYSIPRTSGEQVNAGTRVPLTNLQKGDLVISNNYGHVSIYIGNNQVVHAQCTACGPVKISNLPRNAITGVSIIKD